jgi:hypothetical protein
VNDKKNKIVTSFAVLALVLALSSPSPAAGSYPLIEEAMHSLHDAKDRVEQTKHDFAGHRAAALHAIDEAYHQLELCLQN